MNLISPRYLTTKNKRHTKIPIWNDVRSYKTDYRTFNGTDDKTKYRNSIRKRQKTKEQRKIQIHYALNEMQDKVDENLGTEEENINVKTELLLIGIAYNIRKYHNKKKEMSIF